MSAKAVTRILVASDGGVQSDAALRFARLLTERYDTRVEIICVFVPRIPVPTIREGDHEHECEAGDRPAADALLRTVQQQASRLNLDWPVYLGVGHPPWVIAQRANRTGADIVVLGHEARTDPNTPRSSRHTAELVALAGDVPVIAVATQHEKLPRSALIVQDESDAGKRARDTAERVIAPGGELHAVRSSVGPELLALIQESGAELIAVPLYGETFAVRSLTAGGVADLLDRADVDIVVVPTPSATREGRAGAADDAPRA
jgi:nucleotide-binding universal stress UspA family protein